MTDVRLVVGQNGLGRFGLNLLWWWLSDTEAPYRIAYINDESLTPKHMAAIIRNDSMVTGFRTWKVALTGHTLLLADPRGRVERIALSTGRMEQAPWLGIPTLFFECSGKRSASAELCRPLLTGDTRTIIVSATCYDADATLVFGFNHENFDATVHKIVSYGSCTVNPGVTLSKFFHDSFGVKACTVNVIHNVQKHRLDAGEFHTLHRKFCTLENMAPRLLPFLTRDNFTVNYTVVPWEGVSVIDFAYRLERPPSMDGLLKALLTAVGRDGILNGLIGTVASDTGPEAHIGSPYSAVFVESALKMLGDTAYLFGYFYNEGSSIRMHELASHISRNIR